MKGFYDYIDLILKDGTWERWQAEKLLKQQTRKLNKLDREERANRKSLKELSAKKSA